ncbi:hypothetical protein ACHAWF_011929 [Thalassiosira exigua]
MNERVAVIIISKSAPTPNLLSYAMLPMPTATMCNSFSRTPLEQSDSRSRQMMDMTAKSCADTQAESGNRRNRIRGRRRLKSTLALYFAYCSAVLAASSALLSGPTTASAFATSNRSGLSQRKREWIERSVQYYSTVMRKNVAAQHPPPPPATQMDSAAASSAAEVSLVAQHDKVFVGLATKHYYARFLIKEGKWDFAEKIYRRIIDELASEEDADCDHTKLAVSTLLLALHVQRTGDVKATRAVFVNFFRRVALAKDADGDDGADGGGVTKCSCSAKVLQAYALFEMKCGHSAKSLEIVRRAVEMDERLSPVLGWKQFRDAAAGRVYEPTISFRKRTRKIGMERAGRRSE